MRIGGLAWLGLAALAGATLTLAGRERAWAEGAIAVGTTGDVVRHGIAFGVAVDVAKEMAGEIAVQHCRTFKARKAAERCQVVATFSGECFAIAYDPKPGTPGAGWGIGPDQLVANQKAVAMCEESAGPARKGYCQVERHGCDTTGPKASTKPPERETDAAPETKPDATAARVIDAKAAPTVKEAKDGNGDAHDGKGAKALGQTKETGVATVSKALNVQPKTKLASDRAAEGRGAVSALLPVLAMAGVGLAYAMGQHLRGRTKGGLAERQVLAGGGLAIATAIAIKLLDMAGAGATVAAALAGLIALGAALLA